MGNPNKRHVVASAVLFAIVGCGPAAEQLPTQEPEGNARSLPPEPVVTITIESILAESGYASLWQAIPPVDLISR